MTFALIFRILYLSLLTELDVDVLFNAHDFFLSMILTIR